MEDIATNSQISFYDKAAWYILLIPFASVALLYVVAAVMEHLSIEQSERDEIGQVTLASALLIQTINLILGFSICYRIHQHKDKLTIWIAVIGILATVCLGALTLLFFSFTGPQGC